MVEGVVSFGGGGPGPCDSGGASCSHADFQAGRFHSDIGRHFSSSVLAEALAASASFDAGEDWTIDPEKHRQMHAWRQVELDPWLTALAESGDEFGGQRFNLANAAFASTDQHVLAMDRHTAKITGPTGAEVTIDRQLSFSALIAHSGRFFLAANSHGYVFDLSGNLVTSTEPLVDRFGMSHAIRVRDVIRSGDDIAFAFSTFGDRLEPIVQLVGATGTFRLSDEGRLTARGIHDRAAAAQAAIRSRAGNRYAESS